MIFSNQAFQKNFFFFFSQYVLSFFLPLQVLFLFFCNCDGTAVAAEVVTVAVVWYSEGGYFVLLLVVGVQLLMMGCRKRKPL